MSYNNEDTDALVNNVFDKTNLDIEPSDFNPANQARSIAVSTTTNASWTDMPLVRSIEVLQYSIAGEIRGSLLNTTRNIVVHLEKISRHVFVYFDEEIFDDLADFNTSGNIIIETEQTMDSALHARGSNTNISPYLYENGGNLGLGYLNPRSFLAAATNRLRITSDEITGVVKNDISNYFAVRRASILYRSVEQPL